MTDEFRHYRRWFYAAAIYNAVWGSAVVLLPGTLAYEGLQVRADADDQAMALCDQQHCDCAGHRQIERSSNPSGRQVIKHNPLGPRLTATMEGSLRKAKRAVLNLFTGLPLSESTSVGSIRRRSSQPG